MNKYNSFIKSFTIKYIKQDFAASLVVFFVALPLCLGIALASGASPFAGLLAGIIGGLVVGALSNSNVSVTGPAAGLIAIVLIAITDIGFDAFLLSLLIAGIIQLVLGFIKAGSIANYFPTAVIEGMLAAIGIIIIKKQLPHAFGYDKEHEGDFFNLETSVKHDAINEIVDAINFSHLGIMIIAAISIVILMAFSKIKFLNRIKLIPGALVAVVAGVVINEIFINFFPIYAVTPEHLVQLPHINSFSELLGQIRTPDWSAIGNSKVWVVGVTIAMIASIESLLCIEAGDKLDPYKRFSNANVELKAQGIGNILAGLIGGLPMTSVIVRTSANINAGARTKLSAILHGLFLAVSFLLLPTLLNKIPLASLAAILIMTGLRLASIKTVKHMWHSGWSQFVPFIVTLIAVVFTDLLKGVGLGLVVSIIFLLRGNMLHAYFMKKEDHHEAEIITLDLAQEVSFLNKAAIKETLMNIPENSKLIIDARQTVYIDFDVMELIKDFKNFGSKEKNIDIELINFKEEYKVGAMHNVHIK